MSKRRSDRDDAPLATTLAICRALLATVRIQQNVLFGPEKPPVQVVFIVALLHELSSRPPAIEQAYDGRVCSGPWFCTTGIQPDNLINLPDIFIRSNVRKIRCTGTFGSLRT